MASVPAMTREQAGAAVKAAVAERDAIQANLLELDSSFGKQLLTGAELTGATKRRWEATAATLATLWQVYQAYSAVVDQAAEAVTRHLGPRELAALTALLTGRSVQLARGPAPLAGRDLADPGSEDLTVATAVARMRGAFTSVTEVVSAAEHVWNEEFDPFSNLIEVYIGRLRRIVDRDRAPKLIHTIRGAGYIVEARP